MKLKEARVICKKMIQFNFYHMGIVTEKPEDLSDVTLEDLIKANKLVSRANRRPSKSKSGKKTMQMTCSDTFIAATYTAIMHKGQHPRSANSIAYANGRFVFVIEEKR